MIGPSKWTLTSFEDMKKPVSETRLGKAALGTFVFVLRMLDEQADVRMTSSIGAERKCRLPLSRLCWPPSKRWDRAVSRGA